MCSHTSRTGQPRKALGWSLACRNNPRDLFRANPAGKATLTDQSLCLCLSHRPVQPGAAAQGSVQGSPCLLQGEARKGREAPVPVLSNPNPAVQAPAAAASSTSNPGLSSCPSSPNHLSVSTLQLVTNSSLCLSLNSFLLCSLIPVAVPPPQLSQSPLPSQTDPSSTSVFVFTLL